MSGDKIIVTVAVAGNQVIARAYYRYTYYLLVSCFFDFKSYEYNKYLFSRVGKKLGEDLFFNSKKIHLSLPETTHFYNGYNFDEGSGKIVWAGFDPLINLPRLIKIGNENSINSGELENFCSAFSCGFKKRI